MLDHVSAFKYKNGLQYSNDLLEIPGKAEFNRLLPQVS